MRRTIRATRLSEGGSIAVEMALVLPVLVLFLSFPSLYWAFYLRQYSAVQKAAHDAALYLSTAPRLDLTTTGPDGNFVAVTLAKRIVEKELAGIVPDGVPVDPFIGCQYQAGTADPTANACTASVFKLDTTSSLYRFDVAMGVPFIDPTTGTEVDSLFMQTTAVMRYLGN